MNAPLTPQGHLEALGITSVAVEDLHVAASLLHALGCLAEGKSESFKIDAKTARRLARGLQLLAEKLSVRFTEDHGDITPPAPGERITITRKEGQNDSAGQ